MSSLKERIELVQECYHKVASANNFYTAYRRTSGECGEATPERPEFVALMSALTRTAEELTRREEERMRRFDSVPVLQATLRFADGTTRKVAVSKPSGEIDEPHVGELFHAALVKQGVVETCEPWPVLVVDKRGRVVAEIPARK